MGLRDPLKPLNGPKLGIPRNHQRVLQRTEDQRAGPIADTRFFVETSKSRSRPSCVSGLTSTTSRKTSKWPRLRNRQTSGATFQRTKNNRRDASPNSVLSWKSRGLPSCARGLVFTGSRKNLKWVEILKSPKLRRVSSENEAQTPGARRQTQFLGRNIENCRASYEGHQPGAGLVRRRRFLSPPAFL